MNDSVACNRLSAMDAFRDSIIAHEQEHEKGVNACLSSSTARTMLDEIEKLVGDARQDVTNDAQNRWSTFYNGSLINSGFQARAFPNGSSFWYQFRFSGVSLGWTFGYPGINDHGKLQHGC